MYSLDTLFGYALSRRADTLNVAVVYAVWDLFGGKIEDQVQEAQRSSDKNSAAAASR
jgi:hypothetical protein